MTNYGMQDGLMELWKDILNSHWRFLECEESLQKIAERKKLEGCLREYLSVVSHDKKFLLPETGDCLKTSVLQMKNFSPYKAVIGFESISQYANNLFTKPWRKEYRTIKMYSGFYQHEIKANLLNAEKMFIAMGYKILPNQTMVLEDPICPDQVTNVSRDAMACKVECEIMKHVNSELTAMQLPTNWIEIFNYRERHVGDSTNALKGLAYQIQHRSMRKPQNDNYYNAASIPQSSSASSAQLPPQNSVPYMCNSQCTMQQHPSYQNAQTQSTNPSYPQPIQPQTNIPPPHSYYNPESTQHPIPCSLHMNGSVYGHQPPQNPHSFAHNHLMNYQPQQQQQQQQQSQTSVSTIQIPHSKSLDQYDQNMHNHNNQYFHQHRHSVDHAMMLKNQQMQPSSYDCVDASSCNFSAFKNHPYNVPNNRFPLPYQISNSNLGMYGNNNNQFYDMDPMNYRQQPPAPPPPANYNPYYQQQPVPPPPAMMNDDQYPYYHHHHHHHLPPKPQPSMMQHSDIIPPPPELINFSDSRQSNCRNTDEVKLKSSLRPPKQEFTIYSNSNNNCDGKTKSSNSGQTTPTTNTNSDSIHMRNQEGIGSYDTWNYVFKNLEKQQVFRDDTQNSPDQIEIDFNDLHVSSNSNTKTSSHKNKSSSATNAQILAKNKHSVAQTQITQMANGSCKTPSLVQNKNPVKGATKMNGSANSRRSPENSDSGGPTKSSKKKSISEQNQSKSDEQTDNLWGCRFCTFLNPDSVRICQMCAKSKDFFLDSDNGTTCV